jgi:type I restriction enzyme S subunit
MYWLWFAFKVAGLYSGRGNQTTIPNLSRSALSALPIPLPSALEQSSIVNALDLVQRGIELQENLIALIAELQQAILQKLMTEGLQGEAQRETEIGPIPETWEVVALGDVCKLGTGTTPATHRGDYYGGSIPFIKTTQIDNNRISHPQSTVTELAVQDYGLRIYPKGTILMAMYGQGKTRGKVALLEIGATTTQNAAAIQPLAGMDAAFLWHYLARQYDALRNSGQHGLISHLNLGYVRQFKVPKPNIATQRAIARILDAVDAKQQSHVRKHSVLNDLFRTLLHQLMTAQIRVHDLDLSAVEATLAE